MGKALEAFYKIKAGYICGQGAINEFALRSSERELLDTIEAELKRAEELEIENSEQFKEKWVQDNLAMTMELNVAKEKLKTFDELKQGIAWRKEHYKKEIDTGKDLDGVPLTKTNMMITLNLYNIMCALEGYYEEKKHG